MQNWSRHLDNFSMREEIHWLESYQHFYKSDCVVTAEIALCCMLNISSRNHIVSIALFWCDFGFGKCLGDSSTSTHCPDGFGLPYITNFSSPVTTLSKRVALLPEKQRRSDFETRHVRAIIQIVVHPLFELFHLSTVFLQHL